MLVLKKYKLVIIILVSFFIGCRNDAPSDTVVKNNITQYLQSVNLPMQIDKIDVLNKRISKSKKYYILEVAVTGRIFSNDNKNLIYRINNNYNAKFYHFIYDYWIGYFSLVKTLPSDSVIKFLSSNYFQVDKDQVKVLEVESLNEQEKYYPVKISIPNEELVNIYTLPFSQDEFGVWKIGKSNLVTPEGTIKEFLSEVNDGNSDKARRYFSYEYKFGYDEGDQKKLEELFPTGSIKDILIYDVITVRDTADLKLTVVNSDADTFKTSLQLLRCGIEWRIKYYGWNWKFKKDN